MSKLEKLFSSNRYKSGGPYGSYITNPQKESSDFRRLFDYLRKNIFFIALVDFDFKTFQFYNYSTSVILFPVKLIN